MKKVIISRLILKNMPTIKKISKPKPIGKVTHYFSAIKVAVVKLLAPLSIGDKIRIEGGENTDFKQTIKSIESDHKKIKKARKGAEIGVKVNKKVREGYRVFKI